MRRAYNGLIVAGEGDYITKDALVDFKTIRKKPNTIHTLQLLVYYLMGQRCVRKDLFKDIKKLVIFNPRKNCEYAIDLIDIPQDDMDAVALDVIGYDILI